MLVRLIAVIVPSLSGLSHHEDNLSFRQSQPQPSWSGGSDHEKEVGVFHHDNAYTPEAPGGLSTVGIARSDNVRTSLGI